ncbi:MAG: hypothetical protein JXB32_08620 [Deltaproteobacteria bacterium]|nr:hypothetical protein [Deltaproteobacteria bacterium]
MLLLGTLLLAGRLGPGATSVRADTVLVEDALSDPTTCTGPCAAGRVARGGVFSGSGWTSHARDDVLVYDLGHPLTCGRIEVSVANFAPYAQYVGNTDHFGGQYTEFVSLFEGDHGSHGTSIAQNESILFFKYAPCLVFDGTRFVDADTLGPRSAVWYVYGLQPRNCDPECTCAPDCADRPGFHFDVADWQEGGIPGFDPTTPTARTLAMEWDAVEARYHVDGEHRATVTAPVYPNCCHLSADVPRLRYAFLGGNASPLMGHFDGLQYTAVRISECDDPCAGHCDNGVLDCGEEGIDCGGTCERSCDAPLLDADAGTDGGNDADDLADTPVEDATRPDNHDAPVEDGARPDSPDATTPPVAADDPGCGCRAAGRSDPDRRWALPMLLLALAAVRRRRAPLNRPR